MITVTAKRTDFYLRHTSVDYVLCGVGAAVALAYLALGGPSPDSVRYASFTGLITVSALSMATVTFARSMMYSAPSTLMGKVRELFQDQLRHNWRVIIRDTFAAAVAGVFCFWIDMASTTLSLVVAFTFLGLVVARVARAMKWMDYTQHVENLSALDRFVDRPSYVRDSVN